MKSKQVKERGGAERGDREREKEEESHEKDDREKKGLQIIRPKEQLQLAEEELNEDVHIVLTSSDPQVRDGIVIFSVMDLAYKASPYVEQFATVLDIEGYI